MPRDRDLLTAAARGDADHIATLLAADIPIEFRAKGTGRTALLEAVIAGHTQAAEVLIDHGADIEARDTAVGNTALLWAASLGHTDLVALLIDRGAELEAPDGFLGRTPLIHAAQASHPDTVRHLLAAGSQVDAVDGLGDNALSLAGQGLADSEREAQVRALLVAAGATPPPPLPEPPVLPWPDVVPGEPDYTDPVRLVRGYIVTLHEWEEAAHLALADSSDDLDASINQGIALADRYLCVRQRTYRRASVGWPPTEDAASTLHEIRVVGPSKQELLVREPPAGAPRYERLYIVQRRADQWRLDQVKTRPLGTSKGWETTIV
jgi:hypothetical protein